MKLLKMILGWVGGFFFKKDQELQPKDILAKLFQIMEKRKKLGIEDKAYVPNVYFIYLSALDYEEIFPLLSGIREQLKNKLMDNIRKKNYKLLSTSLVIEIREEGKMGKNQIIVESSFVKERSSNKFEEKETSAEKIDSFHNNTVKITKPAQDFNPVIAGIKVTNNTPDKNKTWGEKIANEIEINPSIIPETMPGKEDEKPAIVVKENTDTTYVEEKDTIYMEPIIKLQVVKGECVGEVIPLREGEYTFGRGKNAQYLIKDSENTVSRVHFKMVVKKDKTRIEDLASRNGTAINDLSVESGEVRRGDIISAGNVILKVA